MSGAVGDWLHGLTVFDHMVLAMIALSMVLGLFRGMVKEVLSLANWVIAFWLANKYGADMAVHMAWVEGLTEPMKALIGCAATFFAAMVVGAIFIALLGRIVSAAGLGFADRGMGVLFGFARGLFIVLVLVTGAGFTSLPKQPFWRDARLSPYAEDAMRTIKPHLPESVAKWVRY
ncbi:CvpA family protein [Limnobacter humi]|uniref:CvpA family protein n=1 Tax=Limnobacter humi TaxID=1778671 RepID=A0ABT1WG35_9BURK|nr:CvpA family protein [Limnobacter humi]